METSARLREGWPSFLLVWAMLLVTSLLLFLLSILLRGILYATL